MKLKDLLGISLISLFLFPVILIGIMLAAGVVHLEFGNGKDKDRIKPGFSADDQAHQQEAEEKALKAILALEQKESELKVEAAQVAAETERLEALKAETDKAKGEMEEHRRKIEELVGKSTEIQDKKIASLAEVYGGMRPDEAAPIMLSLDNGMVVRIMRKIPETKASSKLLAAIAALDVKRAATITTLLGGKDKTPMHLEDKPNGNPEAHPAGTPAGNPAVNHAKPEAAAPADSAKNKPAGKA